ncbi:hypothetical protein LTR36_001881 [Oleoguttula mirabilis]|uniref:Uncharacterized protein n=1 Tax=Oleoguttula mirabilis TaxID=1507867 RepID=A0AAV9JMA3_9PEZI|nr:hypothetical protein LTR36_001881 [Oleoguttula mirabilis]
MAERVCSRDAPTVARRPSFRKTLREHEATLPPEYLEALEQKRKQLDESIHKYIAAKEREYKQYEKDVRQQAKSSSASPATVAQQDGPGDGNVSLGTGKRRTSLESNADRGASSPLLRGQPSAAVDALMASGLRRESRGQPVEHGLGEQRAAMARLTDQRVGGAGEREKDFIGLFTPPFLPAIDNKTGPQLVRADSAPGAVETIGRNDADAEEAELRKSGSDSAMQAKAKRPAHLEVGRRTSSSGSSADGKLASAMKSPIQNLSTKPRKKRVSLAVGDSIVAPSDNVPMALHQHSTPSHSRTRSPATEREQPVADEPTTSTVDFAGSALAMSSAQRVEQIMNGGPISTSESNKDVPAAERAPAAPALPAQTTSASSTLRMQSKIDPDGDLFDLEDESDLPLPQSESDDLESVVDSEEEIMTGIAGRMEQGTDRSDRSEVPIDTPGMRAGEQDEYDPEAGLIPESAGAPLSAVVEEDEHAVHLEFGPAFSSSSQQPTKPGFRRPSVISDPVFRGADYQAVEAQAVNEEVYGSSYNRPTSKGSFSGGSLGESYMAKHAEGMMKLRMAKQQQDVRT